MDIEKILYFWIVILVGFEVGFILNVYLSSENYGNIKPQAPSNYLNFSDIVTYNDMVCLNVSNYSISSYASTGSMKPVISENANGIEVPITNESQLSVGDIVSYYDSTRNLSIAHRIYDIGNDSEGWYFIPLGDNNNGILDGKFRFKDIEKLTIGIIY